MIDREKVIKGLESCTTAGFGCIKNMECPYSAQRYGSHCVDYMLRDALALLKAQEQEAQRDYEAAVEMTEYCERYEPTYNPEDGSM